MAAIAAEFAEIFPALVAMAAVFEVMSNLFRATSPITLSRSACVTSLVDEITRVSACSAIVILSPAWMLFSSAGEPLKTPEATTSWPELT